MIVENISKLEQYASEYIEHAIHSMSISKKRNDIANITYGEEKKHHLSDLEQKFLNNILVNLSFVSSNGIQLKFTARYTYGYPENEIWQNLIDEIHDFDVEAFIKSLEGNMDQYYLQKDANVLIV